MRIFVTGGAGFIGSNLVRMLVGQGHEVLNFDKLTYAGNRDSLRDLESNPLHRLVVGDICDADAVGRTIALFKPNWIMHLAAESHVDRSIAGPGQFIQSNIVGTFNVLSAAKEYWQTAGLAKDSFRFLHVSTDEVYGALGPTGSFNEQTRYDPHSPYAASKASSDHLARAWHDTYGLPVIVSNCSNNYGPYQFPEKLIPVVIVKCLRNETIPVYGQGENVRDWLYVQDHCDALLQIIRNGRIGETYNIGGNNELRNIDLVVSICELVDECRKSKASDVTSYRLQPPASSLITFVADRPGHDFRYAIDATKLKKELGWEPKQDRISGLRATVQWYLDNASWWENILSRS